MKNKLMKLIGRCAAAIDDLLFPQDVLCLCCDHALVRHAVDGVCEACARALELLGEKQELREEQETDKALPPGIDYIHAAYAYEGQARRLIHRLKYESVRAASIPLARRMVFLPSGEEEIIVPVPTDKARERRRGFNQSTLLAEYIAKELGMQVVCALSRVETRRPQTGLKAKERRMNLVGCMRADASVNGKRVLLVDDVCTTGATLQEAARALLAAGASGVGVFAAARAAGDEDENLDPFALPVRRQGEGKKPEIPDKIHGNL